MKNLLKISDLSVQVGRKTILKNLNLSVRASEIHAVMGPNGSGKSTLSYSLIGHPRYVIISGSLFFKDAEISQLSVDKRAKLGLFLAFQYPYEIPGATVFTVLKESYHAITGKLVSTGMFQEKLFEKMDMLKIDHSFAYRGLNDGFSGGEKKRFEMLQLLILKPCLAILDEIDSGLDVDSMKIVADAIIAYKTENPQAAIIIITHYRTILNYVKPDFVHILHDGSIVDSGTCALAKKIEDHGYHGLLDG